MDIWPTIQVIFGYIQDLHQIPIMDLMTLDLSEVQVDRWEIQAQLDRKAILAQLEQQAQLDRKAILAQLD
jgi:hypothetical protein